MVSMMLQGMDGLVKRCYRAGHYVRPGGPIILPQPFPASHPTLHDNTWLRLLIMSLWELNVQ